MIKSFGFWFLEYDSSNCGDKELYYDYNKKLWVHEQEYTSYWYPAIFPCQSLKAAKRHLRKHNEIP